MLPPEPEDSHSVNTERAMRSVDPYMAMAPPSDRLWERFTVASSNTKTARSDARISPPLTVDEHPDTCDSSAVNFAPAEISKVGESFARSTHANDRKLRVISTHPIFPSHSIVMFQPTIVPCI